METKSELTGIVIFILARLNFTNYVETITFNVHILRILSLHGRKKCRDETIAINLFHSIYTDTRQLVDIPTISCSHSTEIDISKRPMICVAVLYRRQLRIHFTLKIETVRNIIVNMMIVIYCSSTFRVLK